MRDGLADEQAALGSLRTTELRNDPIGAIHDLAARTLRRRGRADVLLALVGGRMPEPPLLRELLVVSLALLVDAIAPIDAFDACAVEDEDDALRLSRLPYAPFTLVDQAVHAASSQPDLARAKGFVNAVLRTLLRRIESDRAALIDALIGPRAPEEARYALPSWWVERLRDAYPDRWTSAIAASLVAPSLVVRVNARKVAIDAYLARLADEGVAATRVGAAAVRFDAPMAVSRIPGFVQGLVSVQDEAAQRAAPLLDVAAGMRVLDACAAPGGKTGHVLEIADCDVIALDVDASRLARVRENLDRLSLDATLVVGDASKPDAWSAGRRFDRILADIPCTASGILRRHPDIRWLRRESDVERLSRRAQQITDALWSVLDPGGRFLIVTCSVFPEESACHAKAFASRHADALPRPAPGQLLPSHAGLDRDASIATTDHDGLFFALFEKMR